MYSFVWPEVSGTVTASFDFLTLLNPLASGRNLVLLRAHMIGYAGAATTAANGIHLMRITASTGGSVVAVSDINKFQTAFANPVAELRTGNPVTTLGPEIGCFGPPIQGSATGSFSPNVQEMEFRDREFLLVPGEGVTFAQMTAGDVDQRFCFGIEWGERT